MEKHDLPRDTDSKEPRVFLLTGSQSIAKWLEETIVSKLEETSFMGKTSLWLCVFRQIGLKVTAVEVKRHRIHLKDSRFDYLYMRVRKSGLTASSFTTLTTESLCDF